MGVNILLLYLLYLVNICHGDWWCGGAMIDDKSVCYCGDVNITKDDSERNYINCCGGPDSCTVTEDGSATCPGGEKCEAYGTWRCGDIRRL